MPRAAGLRTRPTLCGGSLGAPRGGAGTPRDGARAARRRRPRGARRPAADAAPGRTPHQGRGLDARGARGQAALLHKGTAPPAAAVPSAGVGRPRAIPLKSARPVTAGRQWAGGLAPRSWARGGPGPQRRGHWAPGRRASDDRQGSTAPAHYRGAGPRLRRPALRGRQGRGARPGMKKTRDSCRSAQKIPHFFTFPSCPGPLVS